MSLIAREAAGREWVYQLRAWVAELDAQGRHDRAIELARLAVETERETALLHTAVFDGVACCNATAGRACRRRPEADGRVRQCIASLGPAADPAHGSLPAA